MFKRNYHAKASVEWRNGYQDYIPYSHDVCGYIEQIYKNHSYKHAASYVIVDAFLWSSTPQGEDFWEHIYQDLSKSFAKTKN